MRTTVRPTHTKYLNSLALGWGLVAGLDFKIFHCPALSYSWPAAVLLPVS